MKLKHIRISLPGKIDLENVDIFNNPISDLLDGSGYWPSKTWADSGYRAWFGSSR